MSMFKFLKRLAMCVHNDFSFIYKMDWIYLTKHQSRIF